MNHKRGRAKNQRAGCLLCKPHKANGVNEQRASVERQVQETPSVLADDESMADIRREVDAMPEGCTEPCCGGAS